jgi:phosphatidylethanolamine/phosphatidyl-N-methylethanolamine N-methyltransferase
MGIPKKHGSPTDLKHKVLEEVRFLRNWVENPRQIGAVTSSSPALAKLMARYVDPDGPGSVIELGPGTGVVTKALLDRGVPPDRLVTIEYEPEFCAILRDRFPGTVVVHGDAYTLNDTVGDVVRLPVTAVVSSLPLILKPLPVRLRLLDEAFEMMKPGSPFIQFSYALVPPIPHGAGRYEIERTNWVVMNLPPARVWIYRRF